MGIPERPVYGTYMIIEVIHLSKFLVGEFAFITTCRFMLSSHNNYYQKSKIQNECKILFSYGHDYSLGETFKDHYLTLTP